MSLRTISRQFRNALPRFVAANRGNVAIVFAITLAPTIAAVGAAVDYSRLNAARTAMQTALDSTALMLSRDVGSGALPANQVASKAQTYFTALYKASGVQSININATYTPTSSIGSTIKVDGSGAVVTQFMKVAGFPQINFTSSATASWGNTRMRVALALDNTGSMADDGKMAAMQTAAKSLVDQLASLAKANGDVYISIIPFAKDVNVGASNYNQTWIDFTDWDAGNGSTVCTKTKKNGDCKTTAYVPNNHNTWTGCVTDRDQDYDTKNTAPAIANVSTLFPAEEYVSGKDSYCKTGNNPYLQPIMPLSYDWNALKDRITAMEPTGNTNQSIGLAWAWQSLSQTAPLNAPAKDSDYTYKDVVILLSDGMNTQNRWYSKASDIDARQKLLCDNVKAAGVTIYAIQVNTDTKNPDPTSSVLQYCSSQSNNFFLVTAASQTLSVFNSIGNSLSKLRIAY